MTQVKEATLPNDVLYRCRHRLTQLTNLWIKGERKFDDVKDHRVDLVRLRQSSCSPEEYDDNKPFVENWVEELKKAGIAVEIIYYPNGANADGSDTFKIDIDLTQPGIVEKIDALTLKYHQALTQSLAESRRRPQDRILLNMAGMPVYPEAAAKLVAEEHASIDEGAQEEHDDMDEWAKEHGLTVPDADVVAQRIVALEAQLAQLKHVKRDGGPTFSVAVDAKVKALQQAEGPRNPLDHATRDAGEAKKS